MNYKYYDFQNFIFNMFNYLDGRIGPVRSYGYKVFDIQNSNVIALTRPFNSIEIYTKNISNPSRFFKSISIFPSTGSPDLLIAPFKEFEI